MGKKTKSGHDIPEPYCYDDSFKTFYANIDDEHKGLFQGIFDCHGDRADGGKLTSLFNKVKTHFATEEGMMQAKGYGEFTEHKAKHEDFVKTLGGLSTPLDDATINFAMDWLVDHIKVTDFKYKGKL